MRATRPANGEGISTVALSVSTSSKGASSATRSPSPTSTLTISASVSPSPRSGSANGRGMGGRASEREGFADGGDDARDVGHVRLLAGEADEWDVVGGHAADRRFEREERAVHDRGRDLVRHVFLGGGIERLGLEEDHRVGGADRGGGEAARGGRS